jgi:adenylate kinase family enzyme
MGNIVAIMGESGSGKSTSIENLDSTKTAIINVAGKDLPFKGWKKKYTAFKGKEGNMLKTANPAIINQCIKAISDNRPEINCIILDDVQYVMAFEFMDKAKDKGFEKFTILADNFYRIIQTAKATRDDLTIIFLAHTEQTNDGKTKMKTIGEYLPVAI